VAKKLKIQNGRKYTLYLKNTSAAGFEPTRVSPLAFEASTLTARSG
jgi:hypothetical protein